MVKTPSPVKVTGSSTPATVPATPVGRPISKDVHAPMRSKRFKIKRVYVCVFAGQLPFKAPLENQQRRGENDATNESTKNFAENQELTSDIRYNIEISSIKQYIFFGIVQNQLLPSVIFSAVSAILSCSIKSSISPPIIAGKLCWVYPIRWSVTRLCG